MAVNSVRVTSKSVTSKTVTSNASVSAVGQSQWALIWREFRKRRLAMVAAVVILILVTTSIFAPLLANAVPIYYYGVNRFGIPGSLENFSRDRHPIGGSAFQTGAMPELDRMVKTVRLQSASWRHLARGQSRGAA